MKALILAYITYASFYGSQFNHARTASGERFSNTKMVAAHKYLPFGTKVKVTNLDNNSSVIVTISDRGPRTRGRDLDLSQAAFKQLAPLRRGVLRVKCEVL